MTFLGTLGERLSVLLPGGSPKTYEMPPDANVTPGIFSRDSFAGLPSALEQYVKFINVTLVVDDKQYTLHHARNTTHGYKYWSVELTGKNGDYVNKIVQILTSTIGRGEPKRQTIDDNVKVVVTVHNEIDLAMILGIMGNYAKLTQGVASVSGYGFEDLPANLAKRVQAAGLPLKEVPK